MLASRRSVRQAPQPAARKFVGLADFGTIRPRRRISLPHKTRNTLQSSKDHRVPAFTFQSAISAQLQAHLSCKQMHPALPYGHAVLPVHAPPVTGFVAGQSALFPPPPKHCHFEFWPQVQALMPAY